MKYGIQRATMGEVMTETGLFKPKFNVAGDLCLFRTAKLAQELCDDLNTQGSRARLATVFKLPGTMTHEEIADRVKRELPFSVKQGLGPALGYRDRITQSEKWCNSNLGPSVVQHCALRFPEGYGFGWRHSGVWAFPEAALGATTKVFRLETDAVHYKLRWG